ncbi:hypothetical protein [Halobacillus sp. Marseille-Q1614]|uniref:hypothetical protein n=1 Tax=Halobacillus sp. Marseille-Q1614 TaxID=2709134 RepID=UPI00156D6D0C|nr:hypothetical protein [Halobacillus sp. Marseille-Q1614]
MKKKSVICLAIVVLVSSSLLYINYQYFYNPLSFEKDKVTPHNWSAYERPLTIKLYTLEEQRETKIVYGEVEIRKVLRELKASPAEDEANHASDVRGGLTLTSDGETLLEVLFYSDHWRILKRNGSSFQITNSLQKAVNEL